MIKVKCKAADELPLTELSNLQGNLKVIKEKNLKKLKKSIKKQGFIAPFFVWKKGKKNYILDGHQRLKALMSLKEDGEVIPSLPVAYVEAKNIKEAKEKLLHITSQHGEYTKDGISDFILDAGIDISELDIRLVGDEFNISNLNNIIDFSEWEKELDEDELKDMEDVSITIIVPKKYKTRVEEWMANGNFMTAPGLGKGVLELCGLL